MVKRWMVPYGKYFVRSARFRIWHLLSGEAPKRIKVLGLQRTGTNYLEQLIACNTDAEVLLGTKPTSLRPIWKHALPQDTSIEEQRASLSDAYTDCIERATIALGGEEGAANIEAIAANNFEMLSELAVGEEKGLGNGRPDTPFTKCGLALTRKAPPKK